MEQNHTEVGNGIQKIINMEKLWKATNKKIKQRIMNVHIFNCHMDVKRGP